MKRIVAWICCITIAGAGFNTAQSQNNEQSWKDEPLNDAGIQTLSDVFQMNTGWFNATNDDATFQFSRNGLAGPGGAWWPVYLDGTRMDLGAWDTQSLHLLPVTYPQVDSVVIRDRPGMYDGIYTEKGGLFIYTQPPKQGLQVEADLVMGNKSGDPGPFVYTDRATRNLERLGPTAYSSISYRQGDYAVEVGAKRFIHSVSDPLQHQRLTPFQFGEGRFRHPKIESHSGYLRGRFNTGRLQNRVQVAATEATDFLFTGIHGIEVPVDRNWRLASLNGSGHITDQTSIRYRIKHSINEVQEHPNKEDAWLRWHQRVTSGQASVSRAFPGGSHETGIGFDLYNMDDAFNDGNQLSMHLIRAFNRFEVQLSDVFTARSDLVGTRAGRGSLAAKARVGLQARAHPGHIFSLDLSYSERFPEEDNSLWYWMAEKGFGGDTLAAYRPAGLTDRIRFLRAELGWSASPADYINIKTGASVSRNLDEYLFRYMLEPGDDGPRTGSYSFIDDLDATFLKVPLNISIRYSPSLRQRLNYTWQTQLRGSFDLAEMAPNHRLNLNMEWTPDNSFKLWTRLQAQSATNWTSADSLHQEEVRINALQQVTYSSVFSSRLQWDVGLHKKLWDNRILFRLDALNILNRTYRNHPIAPRHAFTIFFRVGLSLPG